MYIEKKIKDVIVADNWFKQNYPQLEPVVGEYSPVGNVYPSIAYNIDLGRSESVLPASRHTLTFVIYTDDNNKAYGVLTKLALAVCQVLNRKPQVLCDFENGLRIVKCLKVGGEIFFNKEINKRGIDLTFEVIMSEGEEYDDVFETPAEAEYIREYITYRDHVTGKLIRTWFENGEQLSQEVE